MNLPEIENLVVERIKIESYLLNPAHPFGGSKARFLVDFGFTRNNWEVLAEALLEHGKRYPVARSKETGFGPRYEVDGRLRSPDGRDPRITTVWQIDRGEIAPRLITAYPMERS